MDYPISTKAAVYNKKTKSPEVKEIPIAALCDDEIPVENKLASIAVVDSYHIDNEWSPDGAVLGVGLCGIVLRVGPSVSRSEVGDHISSFIPGGSYSDPSKGAYAKYAVIQEVLSVKVPQLTSSCSNIIPYGVPETFESSGHLARAFVTVSLRLFKTLGGSFETKQDKILLIYGGSTGIGLMGSQIAKIFGWKVISIASKRHEPLMS